MGASPYRRYLSAAHTDQYEILVKNTTHVLKTTTYRESVEINSRFSYTVTVTKRR